MDYSKFSKAFRSFAEGFTLLAEALEEGGQGLQDPVADVVPEVFEEPAAWQEEEKKAEKVAKKTAAKKAVTKKTVSKKVWDEEPPAEKDPEVIELGDLQEAGRQAIKLLGAPALAKVLKSNGLKNLSSADPEDYPALYAEIKELTDV